MPILQWNAAHGDAAPISVACESVVHLAPWDNSIDTNIVHIVGQGTIQSFGWGQASTKRVLFEAGIVLKHSEHLQLLGLQDREINEPAIGIYATAGDNYWNEISFTATGAAETIRRLDAIVQRLEDVENRLFELQNSRSESAASSERTKTHAAAI
ncbi:MAG TPA: hypothetical protein VGH47_13730 [Xanthobacteraceae bacterium]|jgi:hypothetical protein